MTIAALAGVPAPEGGFAFSSDTLLFDINEAALPVETPVESAEKSKFSLSEEKLLLRGRPGVSGFAGWEGSCYQGRMTDYLGAMNYFNMGAAYVSDRFMVQLDMSFGGAGRLRNGGFSHDGYTWQEGEDVTGAKITLAAGYRVLELGRISFSPCFGFGISALSQGTGEYEYDGEGGYYEVTSDCTGLRYFGGFRLDIPFFRSFTIDPSAVRYSPSFGDVHECGIALTFFVARDAISAPCPALSLNVGVQFYFTDLSLF